ncbi:MAG TPA: tRNA glutamyl-Q(34) synthetase GluQRS [Bacillales bacterium]|nr:tRNA glutamyl-Q(34) synthetase GluQRS [Bacillales bacterium]
MMRGRFAPTPSGDLHIGNALTAMLAWLQVRKNGGTFVLRIEDLDRPRCRPTFYRRICEDLRWLGLDWDEGPDVGGGYGPYEQGKRGQLYEAAFARLEKAGRLYPCFCSRKELRTLASAPHGLSSLGPAYPGLCRGLSAKEREARAKGKRPSHRFAVPDEPVAFDDAVMGRQTYSPGSGGDFVVKRADGIMSYQLAVVVDDAEMDITHVLRGADLLDSTVRQILLYRALRLPVPKFAHVPLIYGPDGQRLSKRHGEWITVSRLRENGVSAQRLMGILAFLAGLLEQPESLALEELLSHFTVETIREDDIHLDEPFVSKWF